MKVVSVAFLLLAATAPNFAQTSAGSISGNVRDAQQASVANATVVATDQAKRTVYRATTDAQGRFSFAQLPPSTYTLAIEAPGFKKFEMKDQVLNANDKLAVGNLTLEVGAVDQTIEVEAQATELKTESAERSEAIVGKQLQNTLINGRSYLDLTKLIPGVYSTVNSQTAGHGGVGSISANGARQNQNNLTLNGLGNVDTGNNGDQLATISLDSVQEFKILTSNYQAEYGRSSGAQISVVTKSGTSDFHGSGYLFHRNEGLNANNWKNNRDGLQRNKFRFNDAGYTIGGPAYIPKVFNRHRDKLFFFWSQEYQEQLKPQGAHNQTVPTALERQGDFSQSVDKSGNPFPYIRDYTTGQPCGAANTAGCFAAGGVLGRIPLSRLSPSGQAILNLYPLPNATQFIRSGYDFTSQISDSYPRREDLIRIDYNLSDKWKVFTHYVNNSDAVTSYYGSFVLGSSIPKVPITDARPGKSFAVGVTGIFSPTLTNESTFGFSHNQINIDPVNKGLTRAANGLSGLNVLYPGAIQEDFIPTFGFNGTRINNTASFGTNNAPFFNYNTTVEYIDNLSKVWNQHVFKTGAYIQRSRKDQTSFANANGFFEFGDNASNPFDSQFGFANAALGVYSGFTQASAYLTGKYRYTNAEFYLQDTWKVTRKLTLDYGMRFAYIQPQFDALQQTSTFLPNKYNPADAVVLYRPGTDAQGNKVAVNPLTGQTLDQTTIGKIVPGVGNPLDGIFQAGKGINKYLMTNRGFHYGPRFGFAYDPTGASKMVIRGGGGVFYDRYQGNEIFDELTNPPSTFQPTLVNGLISGIDPKNITLAPSSLLTLDPNGNNPTVYNYSLGIQYKLPFDFVLDTSYVGSLSRHLLQKLNLNAIPYKATFLPQNQDPTKVASSPNAVPGSNAYDANFLRPYPGYGDISVHGEGDSSNYNSLQVSAERRFTSGLFFALAYTWSKALGTTSGDGDFVRIDGLTRFANYGPLSFDRRQLFALNYVYDVPSVTRHFGGADNFATRAIFNGWQISGITTAQTGGWRGVGFSIPGIGNQQLTGSYTEGARIHLIGDPLVGTTSSPYNRISPAAFAPPPVGSIGIDSPNRYIQDPGFVNFDISLQKQFSIKERVTVQLRADAFNAFNHTQFNGLNSTINYKSLTDSSITNLVFKSDGSVNNINGFGSVGGARDPRIMQLVVRLVF
ncbi:MAG: TonB-dependent receptor [Acidobacteriota bacterium]|nr:TonB-dependent receptor [Acidobacteriota bacterium]